MIISNNRTEIYDVYVDEARYSPIADVNLPGAWVADTALGLITLGLEMDFTGKKAAENYAKEIL